MKAFAERFEQRDPKTRARTGALQNRLGIGGSLSGLNRKSALLLPNWFDNATEYRLKKALVRRLDAILPKVCTMVSGTAREVAMSCIRASYFFVCQFPFSEAEPVDPTNCTLGPDLA